MTTTDHIQAGLEQYYQQYHTDAPRITDVKRISDGWETEIYAFVLHAANASHERILRLYPGLPEIAVPKSSHEYAVLTQLAQVGYPVPRVDHHNTDSTYLGGPFIIMERIDGQPLAVARRAQPEQETALLTRFCQLFVDLHRLDASRFQQQMPHTPHAPTPEQFLPLKIEQAQQLIVGQFGQAWAVPVIDWLAQHMSAITPAPLSPLHVDFHSYNILLTPADQMVVIDWSGLEIGDYRYDLAWTLLLESTQGHPRPTEIYGYLLSEYDRLAGKRTTDMAYFDVIAAMRRLFIISVALSSGGGSLGMRAEATAIMRGQVAHIQRVYAVLQGHTGLHLPEIERIITTLSA